MFSWFLPTRIVPLGAAASESRECARERRQKLSVSTTPRQKEARAASRSDETEESSLSLAALTSSLASWALKRALTYASAFSSICWLVRSFAMGARSASRRSIGTAVGRRETAVDDEAAVVRRESEAP